MADDQSRDAQQLQAHRTVCLSGGRLELRPVSPLDAASLLPVYRACEDFLALGPHRVATDAVVTADLTQSAAEGGLFRAIWWQGRLIGVVDHRGGNHDGESSLAYIALLMIVSSERGLGIGSAVVGEVEAEVAGDAGVRDVGCSVQVNNPDALRFWRRLGYVVVSGPEVQPDGTTVVHLRKRLPPYGG